ncbi:MAG: sterol desaturase family protein [Oligoflexales bacterium]
MDHQWTRLSFSLVLFVILAGLEYWIPRRKRAIKRRDRWSVNLSIIALNALLFSVLFSPYLFSEYIARQQYGLMNYFKPTTIVHILLTILSLDLWIYLQHLVFHRVNFLWKIHKVHHSDQDLDVSSGLRFHPIEIFLSLILKSICIGLIGANPFGVIAFEVILNGCSLFNHSNIFIKEKWDHILQRIIVTPDMHRIHHSTEIDETNSNYGFSLSCWDHIFRTYKDKALKGQLGLSIGLLEYPYPNEKINLQKIIKIPFAK